MKRRNFVFLLIAALLLFGGVGFWSLPHQDTPWSSVIRLSSANRAASEATIVADVYGYVHVFWAEENADTSNILVYSRFDGSTWSFPVDIYLSQPNNPINDIAAFVDEQGTLHVLWAEGLAPKFMRYSNAPAVDALSSSKWATPLQIRIQADQLDFVVDKDGTFHVVFGMNNTNGRGVFYTQSRDRGVTWTIPVWLDPDNPPDLLPAKISLKFDDAGGMHALWYYKSFLESDGDWVRYTHSFDQGRTWAKPFTIAKNSEGDDALNAFASPVMTISGQSLHVIWAGGDLLYRHYRQSEDAGQTWSDTTRILGDLNGQAGDGMAVDSLGRPHYFAQIRFPVGIYHSVLQNNQWIYPEMVYFIRFSNTDKTSTRIEAHATYPAIRLGNQVILTFTDPPPTDLRGLYVTTSTLADAPAVPPAPIVIPGLTATPAPLVTSESSALPTNVPTDGPSPTPTNAPVFDTTPSQIGSPNTALVWGVIVAFTLVLGVLAFRQFSRS